MSPARAASCSSSVLASRCVMLMRTTKAPRAASTTSRDRAPIRAKPRSRSAVRTLMLRAPAWLLDDVQIFHRPVGRSGDSDLYDYQATVLRPLRSADAPTNVKTAAVTSRAIRSDGAPDGHWPCDGGRRAVAMRRELSALVSHSSRVTLEPGRAIVRRRLGEMEEAPRPGTCSAVVSCAAAVTFVGESASYAGVVGWSVTATEAAATPCGSSTSNARRHAEVPACRRRTVPTRSRVQDDTQHRDQLPGTMRPLAMSRAQVPRSAVRTSSAMARVSMSAEDASSARRARASLRLHWHRDERRSGDPRRRLDRQRHDQLDQGRIAGVVASSQYLAGVVGAESLESCGRASRVGHGTVTRTAGVSLGTTPSCTAAVLICT